MCSLDTASGIHLQLSQSGHWRPKRSSAQYSVKIAARISVLGQNQTWVDFMLVDVLTIAPQRRLNPKRSEVTRTLCYTICLRLSSEYISFNLLDCLICFCWYAHRFCFFCITVVKSVSILHIIWCTISNSR